MKADTEEIISVEEMAKRFAQLGEPSPSDAELSIEPDVVISPDGRAELHRRLGSRP